MADDTKSYFGETGKSEKGEAFAVPEGDYINETAYWKDHDAFLAPPMPPEQLREICRKSPEIPKNTQARAQKVAGFGYSLTPTIDFTADEADVIEQITTALELQRIAQYSKDIAKAVEDKKDISKVPVPPSVTETDIKNTRAIWKRKSKIEYHLLKQYLDNLCYEMPLHELIKKTELNKGQASYCGWQVIPDALGRPLRLKLLEPFGLRATPVDPKPQVMTVYNETSATSFEPVPVEMRFRRWGIRQQDGDPIFYKELGDKRVLSNKTGVFYEDHKAFKKAQKDNKEAANTKPANAIIVWAEYSPGAEPYGMVPWCGQSLDVESARKAREFTWDELANFGMPRGVWSIIDAVAENSILDSFKSFLKNAGTAARNRFALLKMGTSDNAVSGAAAGRAEFKFTDLSGAQRDDQTHKTLKDDVDSGVGEAFGNPPVILGRTKDMQNRSVAEIAEMVAEMMRYRALREAWDYAINGAFVKPRQFLFWRFKLNAPQQPQVEKISKALDILVKNHVITPAEGRVIAEKLMGVTFEQDARWWMHAPPKAVLSGQAAEFLADKPPGAEEDGKPEKETGLFTDDPGTTGDEAQAVVEVVTRFMGYQVEKMVKRLGLSRREPILDEGEEDTDPQAG